MKYDFETFRLRRGVSALKWDMIGDQPDDVVPLSVADMELLSPPQIINAMKETAEYGMYGYSWWDEKYGKAVQHWMKTRHNWEIDPSWIVQTNGVVPALHAAVRAYTQPGDNVLLITPVYYPFYRAVQRNKRNIVESPLKLEDGRYQIDFEDLEAKARQCKMLILCSPHNPVARVWTEEELRRIGDICLENNVLVVSDEIHFDLVMPGYKHTVYATLGEKYAQNCLVCTAPSKTFSLAAMSMSNIIIPNKELREAFDVEVNTSGCYTYNIFGLRATEVGYTECADWVDELLEHIHGNYLYFKNFMAEHFPAVKVFDLEGTYLCWFDCRCFGLKGEALEKVMKEEAKLYLDDGYIFGEAGDGFERINLACSRKVLENSLERFQKVFDKYPVK